MADTDSKYLPELMAEKDSIDPSFVHAVRLITQEIEKLKNPPKPEPAKQQVPEKILLDVVSGRPSKIECDIRVPTEEYPTVNFVGRLIGPGGSTMKGIQEITNTRMAVLGKGSVREKDKKKVEEAKGREAEKYAHLKHPLHVHISALAPVPQAYVNLGRACAEIQKVLHIDEETEAQFGAAQGMQMGGMGRGGMRGGFGGRGRGGIGGNARGGRGGRGGFQSRGGSNSSRGNGSGSGRGSRGGGRGRGGRGSSQQTQYGTIKSATDSSFTEDYTYDYGASASVAAMGGYDASAYGMEGYEDAYDASYDPSYGAEAAAYGEAGYGDAYDEYGYGAESYGADAFGNGSSAGKAGGFGGAQSSFRGKMGGRGMRGRQKPY